MRKFEKQLRLASAFKAWYDKNPKRKYNSSKDPYYRDVVAELLICQGGLCAYTEKKLVDASVLEKIKDAFLEGKLSDAAPNLGSHIELEHFDSRLKETEAWRWDNLFAVFETVNHDKRTKHVDAILKPDLEAYDPFKVLAYESIEAHIFVPSLELEEREKERVAEMITVLGLNQPLIAMQRRDLLCGAAEYYRLTGTWKKLDQFPTAYSAMMSA
jgi:hypothetical protein